MFSCMMYMQWPLNTTSALTYTGYTFCYLIVCLVYRSGEQPNLKVSGYKAIALVGHQCYPEAPVCSRHPIY